MEDKKRKRLIQNGILISLFILFFAILWIAFILIRLTLIEFLVNQFHSTAIDFICRKILPCVAGVINLIISTIVTSYVKLVIEMKSEIPQILVEPCQENNISGVRKDKNVSNEPKVKIGVKNDRYRIVYARIENIGKSIVSECKVEDKLICHKLSPGESKNLYIILYDSPDDIMFFEKQIMYSFQDIQGKSYTGQYLMQIDLVRGQVLFQMDKNRRRR